MTCPDCTNLYRYSSIISCNIFIIIKGGLIPLHNACSFGHVEVTLLLLRHSADVNARDNWNYTPLHEAAIKGKVDVCLGKSSLIIFHVVTVSPYVTVTQSFLARIVFGDQTFGTEVL